jgi:dipeptidyl aminopeptidase/acylaminoacyl peptidase
VRRLAVAAFALVAARLAAESPAPPGAKRPIELSDYYRVETATNPAISPDGGRVAFVRSRIVESENGRVDEIWLVRHAALVRLASSAAKGLEFRGRDERLVDRVHPRGETAARRASRAQRLRAANRRTLQGTHLRVAELSRRRPGVPSRSARSAGESRPGALRGGASADAHQRDEWSYERADLWLVPLEGDMRRLTDDGHHHSDPAFSPDGGSLVFKRQLGLSQVIQAKQNKGVPIDLYRMELASGGLHNLTADWDLIPGSPLWSGDGRLVLFEGETGGESQLFRAPIVRGPVEPVTRGHRRLSDTSPRGSTGYGEEFQWATWGGGWGLKDSEDVLAGVDAALSKYRLDPKRLGVGGYSYGGFLTNWIIGHTTRFAAAVSGAGISNWVSDYGTADIPRTKESEFYGTPWRVPIEQGEQMYVALKKRRVPARFVRYPDTGHGDWTPWNTVHRYDQELRWWDEQLGGAQRRR